MTKEDAEIIIFDLCEDEYDRYVKSWDEIKEEISEEIGEEPKNETVDDVFHEEVDRWSIYEIEPLDPNNEKQKEKLIGN
ncbi:MAG: hypothetical protein ACOCP8_08015, partial [archaeon]